MVGTISPRYGVDVYIGEDFDVVLKQYRHGDGDQVVILHRDEAKELIAMLESAIKQSQNLETEHFENE